MYVRACLYVCVRACTCVRTARRDSLVAGFCEATGGQGVYEDRPGDGCCKATGGTGCVETAQGLTAARQQG